MLHNSQTTKLPATASARTCTLKRELQRMWRHEHRIPMGRCRGGKGALPGGRAGGWPARGVAPRRQLFVPDMAADRYARRLGRGRIPHGRGRSARLRPIAARRRAVVELAAGAIRPASNRPRRVAGRVDERGCRFADGDRASRADFGLHRRGAGSDPELQNPLWRRSRPPYWPSGEKTTPPSRARTANCSPARFPTAGWSSSPMAATRPT